MDFSNNNSSNWLIHCNKFMELPVVQWTKTLLPMQGPRFNRQGIRSTCHKFKIWYSQIKKEILNCSKFIGQMEDVKKSGKP